MTQFSEQAKPANRRAHTYTVASLVMAAIAFTSRFIIDRYRGILDLLTIALITTAVFLYTKYISTVYFYESFLTDEGEMLFIVRKVVGKRSSTLCRISYAEILSIKKETKEELKAHKTPRGVLKYLYTPTLFPENVYRIQMRNAYERSEIVIECSDALASTLAKDSAEVRSLRAQEDD